VGIAGDQTGVYPVESPGGWRLIGRTAIRLFDPARDNRFFCKPATKSGSYPSRPKSSSALKGDHSRHAIVRVITPGLFTTVQDLGRPGALRLGIPPSGAMDRLSLYIANVLVGNDPGAACLEMTLVGPRLEFESDSRIAITGADLEPRLNSSPVEMWSALRVSAGARSNRPALGGCRGYLAIAEDSRSCRAGEQVHLRPRGSWSFGGRSLRAGTSFCPAYRTRTAPRAGCRPDTAGAWGDVTARIVWGPQDGAFEREALSLLVTCEFKVNPKSDRMATGWTDRDSLWRVRPTSCLTGCRPALSRRPDTGRRL